VYIEK